MSIWRASFDEEADREQKEQKLNLRSNSFLNSILADSLCTFFQGFERVAKCRIELWAMGKIEEAFSFSKSERACAQWIQFAPFYTFFRSVSFPFFAPKCGKVRE